MARPEHREWLQREVCEWEREGVISSDQSRAILARYPAQTEGLPWGMIIFACLGAVIVGLGIILLLAYNWDEIPKYAKMTIVLGSLAVVHAVGLKLTAGGGRFQALGEGISLLGTMLFGAGIWLVAQIYNIDEHFPNAFLIWGLGALAMALAMPSIPQAILAVVLLTVWGGAERVAFATPVWVAPALLVALIGPLAWQRRSRLLLAVLIPAVFLAYGFSIPTGHDHAWELFSTMLSLSALFLAVSYLVRSYGAFPGSGPVFWFFGGSVFMVMLYLLSFPSLAREFFYWNRNEMTWVGVVYGLIPLVLALSAWGAVARLKITGALSRQEGDAGPELFLIPLTVILGVVNLLVLHRVHDWAVAGPFNLVFIGLAVSLMARGCQEGLIKQTVLGSVFLVLIVVARYFDLFESQLVRGLVFVVMGALLLAEGFFYARAKKQKVEGGAR